jgi:hypothetical protein
MLRASVLTGQQLQRASFALARVGHAAAPWRLLTHDFVPVAPDPLRLPVNVLPIQVPSHLLPVYAHPPHPLPPLICSRRPVRHLACARALDQEVYRPNLYDRSRHV